MRIEIDTDNDLLVVDNRHYSLCLFRSLENWPVGQVLRIVSREDNGAIALEKINGPGSPA